MSLCFGMRTAFYAKRLPMQTTPSTLSIQLLSAMPSGSIFRHRQHVNRIGRMSGYKNTYQNWCIIVETTIFQFTRSIIFRNKNAAIDRQTFLTHIAVLADKRQTHKQCFATSNSVLLISGWLLLLLFNRTRIVFCSSRCVAGYVRWLLPCCW